MECPDTEATDRCPDVRLHPVSDASVFQGPCCGEKDCQCTYVLGSKPLELNSTKSGLCSFQLSSVSGSQVNAFQHETALIQVLLNFLNMHIPAATGGMCESWLRLQEIGNQPSSIIGDRYIKAHKYRICSPDSKKKYCGMTVPNYPGPSVFTSGKHEYSVLPYFLPTQAPTL